MLSVVTAAELELGVLRASDPSSRAMRLATLSRVRAAYPLLPISGATASCFARLADEQLRAGRTPRRHDTWIAATALHQAVAQGQRGRGRDLSAHDADSEPLEALDDQPSGPRGGVGDQAQSQPHLAEPAHGVRGADVAGLRLRVEDVLVGAERRFGMRVDVGVVVCG